MSDLTFGLPCVLFKPKITHTGVLILATIPIRDVWVQAYLACISISSVVWCKFECLTLVTGYFGWRTGWTEIVAIHYSTPAWTYITKIRHKDNMARKFDKFYEQTHHNHLSLHP